MPDPFPKSPDARQARLKARAADGRPLALAQLAEEFGVSPDTIRRDLLALEAEGAVRRIRGGALPVLPPDVPMLDRVTTPRPEAEKLAAAVVPELADGMVLVLDGGTSVLQLARTLPPMPCALVVTPAPAVALETLSRGIETVLVGGKLSAFGGVATGQPAEAALEKFSADLCVLGVCGLDAGFGLSADDLAEATLKRAMSAASVRTIALAGARKLGRRARHQVLPVTEIDLVITDADPGRTRAIQDVGVELRHV
ncbi:DeoR family transcriptional regulator [Aliiruegeria haliotis]|uniref:DeoR family transcriptional regulator n=1 Tax=Aliiruegeria haliotis TaxID=1280846 RepID=A0A2T0RN12_9RHOB|nr:DeoR/GlpR family DNA-binding transcription regulator [Aliiruegeria haliotis]PRY22510.1 DeoR family transcriptional regulator [Aliiruegeria haliotis]